MKRGKKSRKTAVYPFYLDCVVLHPHPTPEICKARATDVRFKLIPIDRCVPNGFKVSSSLPARAPISVLPEVGKGGLLRPELRSPSFLEIRHCNFVQPSRAGSDPLCLSSRMPSSGKPAALYQRGARACETDRLLRLLALPHPSPSSSPSFPPSLPPSSGILASSVRALVSLEGAGQRSHSRYLKGNQTDRPPRFIVSVFDPNAFRLL